MKHRIITDQNCRCPSEVRCILCGAPEVEETPTVEQLTERLARLQAVSMTLTGAVTAAEVAEVILGQGIAALGARRAVLVRMDPDDDCLEIVHGQGYPEEALRGWDRIPMDAQIPLAEAARTRQPIWLHCAEERNARFPIFCSLNQGSSPSGAILPLIVGERLIGAISFGFSTPHPFYEGDRTFLLAWAEQGAQALERARLYDAAHREIEQRKQAQLRSDALADLGRRLGAARTPLDAARIIVDVAHHLLGWDACSFDLFGATEEDSLIVLAMDTLNGERVEVPPAYEAFTPDTMAWTVVHEGAQLVLRNAADPAASEPQETKVLTPFGDVTRRSASLMFVPIRSHEQVIGVLSIQSYTPDDYDERDLVMLQALADHCSGALNRMRVEQNLQASEQRFQALAESSGMGIWQVKPDGTTLYANAAMCAMLEVGSPEELASTTFHSFFTPESLEIIAHEHARRAEGVFSSFEVDLVGRNRTRRSVLTSGAALFTPEGRIDSLIDTFTDITERNRHQKIIEWQAYHDALTGLPNRGLFFDRLEQLIAARSHPGQVGVLFIDLDRFKHVNDTLGHAAGDRLLMAVAERFTRCIRAEDTLARMGGDEFTLLLPGLHHPEQAIKVARKLQEALSDPIRIDNRDLFVAASIGISLYPTDGEDAQTLLKHADVAMYRAKEQGRNGCRLFTEAMNTSAFERLVMESSLRHAIERGEFTLFYQPQIELDHGQVFGVEALIRWRHPELGMIGPYRFIPLAEETGLIDAVGEWVLHTACRQAAAWRAEGYDLRVAVNLSGSQFRQTGLAKTMEAALTQSGLPAERLDLELTESVLFDNGERSVEMLEELKRLGVRLSIDDFGAGYSSLSYLRRFPIDAMKLDRSFVHPLPDDPKNQAVVRSLIELSHALEIRVIAEGVETSAQSDCLRTLHCDAIQGDLVSVPLPPEELEKLLRSRLQDRLK